MYLQQVKGEESKEYGGEINRVILAFHVIELKSFILKIKASREDNGLQCNLYIFKILDHVLC